MVAGPRNQIKLLMDKGLPTKSGPFIFEKRSRRVQNFSQLGRDSYVVFLRHVTVNTER